MIINTSNARHYRWGDDKCDGWSLLERHDLSVIQERVPPGGYEKRHYHQKSTQLFYILRGNAVMEKDGVRYEMKTGDSIVVEPGAQHKFMNVGSADVVFLVISSPESHGDRVEVE
jgi:mannose-6-phosphate isomerase-like protein (cupin superfamily)